MTRPRVWAEIDLDAVRDNLRLVQSAAEPARVMVVVKADAYGHGAVPVAWTVVRHGAYGLGVGNAVEALELREAGISAPILILGAIVEGEVREVVSYGIATGIHSAGRLDILEREARRQGRRARVHLVVDTGMGRLGVSASKARALLERIQSSRELHLEGVATHFPASGIEDSDGFSAAQIQCLLDSLRIDPEAPRDFVLHAANSGAVFMSGLSTLDLVRPGIAIYGINPGHLPRELELRPVLSLRSQVIFLKDVAAGTPVGYGRTWLAPRATRIATVPVGYDDGYSYRLSGRASVLVRGRRVPVVGTVTMDYLMCDVGSVPAVSVGDVVTLIGRDGEGEIRAEELAEQAGTIPYEITCQLGKRVKRIYCSGEDAGS